MIFFKKKKKVVQSNNVYQIDEKKKKEALSKKLDYVVIVCDPLGDNSWREVLDFYASKIRDENGLMWLANDEMEFREPFPADTDDKVHDSKEKIKKQIQELKDKKISPNENKKNVEEKIFKLEQYLRAIEVSGKGSYITYRKDGVPIIRYMRKDYALIPLKANIKLNTIHTPATNHVKNAVQVALDKKEKRQQSIFNQYAGMATLLFLMLIVLTGVNAYWSYKNYTWADDSNYAKMQQRIEATPLYCAEMYGQAGKNFLQASENALNLTQTANLIANPPPVKNEKIINVK